MTELEIRQERSIPVQGRVDIVELADLLLYFEDIGIRINTMSILLNTCVSMARAVAFDNEKLKVVHKDIGEAHQTLDGRELYQPGLMKRGGRKLTRGRQFSNLRTEGVDPKQYQKEEFNQAHNKSSVMPANVGRVLAEEENRKLVETYKKLEEEGGSAIQQEPRTKSNVTKDTSEIMPTIEETMEKQEEEEELAKQSDVDPNVDSQPTMPKDFESKGSSVLRTKTSAELDADEEARAARDKELAEADWSAPE